MAMRLMSHIGLNIQRRLYIEREGLMGGLVEALIAVFLLLLVWFFEN